MLINKASDNGSFVGYAFGNKTKRLSHLQFADNTIIMGPKTMENVVTIKAILHLFKLVLGMKVNFHKSRLIRIKTTNIWVTEASKVWKYKAGANHSCIWARRLAQI